jgi:hypothetical protein
VFPFPTSASTRAPIAASISQANEASEIGCITRQKDLHLSHPVAITHSFGKNCSSYPAVSSSLTRHTPAWSIKFERTWCAFIACCTTTTALLLHLKYHKTSERILLLSHLDVLLLNAMRPLQIYNVCNVHDLLTDCRYNLPMQAK